MLERKIEKKIHFDELNDMFSISLTIVIDTLHIGLYPFIHCNFCLKSS